MIRGKRPRQEKIYPYSLEMIWNEKCSCVKTRCNQIPKKHFTTKLIKYNLHQIKCRLTICLLKTYKAMKVKRPSLLIFILGWLNLIYYHILLYIVWSVKGELTFLIHHQNILSAYAFSSISVFQFPYLTP